MKVIDRNGRLKVIATTPQPEIKTLTETITIAAASYTDSSTSLLPTASYILGVSFEVVVVIPTATTFRVGDTSVPVKFGKNISTAFGTVSNTLRKTHPLLPFGQKTADKIRITPNTTPGAATGQVYVKVFYLDLL